MIVALPGLFSYLFFSGTFLIVQGSLKDSYILSRRMTMERPQNSRFKLVAFNCDLDLESALLSYGLGEHGADVKLKAPTHDLDL